jgi:ribonuclease D
MSHPSHSGRGHPRQRHRSRQHDAAHAAHEHEPVAIPDHYAIARGPAAWVDTPQALAELLAHARAAGSFAYDSEFIGESSYFPKLCLLQIATPQRVALVDPLAAMDLTGLWQLIADPAVEKVVHAGQQDLEPVYRLIGRPPANVLDVQIAAGFVGLAYPTALSKLVKHLLGIHLGKGFTFTHWDQRPLSGVQLRYAADDVRFLPAMRLELQRQLDLLGHGAWAAEESAQLCDPLLYEFDPHADYRKLRGAGSLQPANLAVLRHLVQWRDQAARQANLPARSYVRDDVLLDLAHRPIKRVQDLARIKGLPRPVEAACGQQLLQLTQEALALPASQLPSIHHVEPDPRQRFQIDALWALVQAICLGQSIDPALASSRAEMTQLHHALRTGQDPSQLRLMQGWRHQAVGRVLLRLAQQGEAMQLRWDGAALHADVPKS